MLFTLKDAILDYFGKQINKQLAKKNPKQKWSSFKKNLILKKKYFWRNNVEKRLYFQNNFWTKWNLQDYKNKLAEISWENGNWIKSPKLC